MAGSRWGCHQRFLVRRVVLGTRPAPRLHRHVGIQRHRGRRPEPGAALHILDRRHGPRKVQFLLFKDADVLGAYRELHLYVTGTQPGGGSAPIRLSLLSHGAVAGGRRPRAASEPLPSALTPDPHGPSASGSASCPPRLQKEGPGPAEARGLAATWRRCDRSGARVRRAGRPSLSSTSLASPRRGP